MADELRQLDVIGRTASRMQTLIDALLHHAEVGRAQVGLELVDMNHVVDEALAMLAVQVASSGAVVRRGRIVEVRGDARLLTVLMRNLLSNALRFARTPVPIVKVSCVPVPGGWRLEVADNGVGIPEHEHERIFEMFERVDRSRHGGFGVGLATVKRIAQLHGGRVEVESTSAPRPTSPPTIRATPVPRRSSSPTATPTVGCSSADRASASRSSPTRCPACAPSTPTTPRRSRSRARTPTSTS